MTFSGNLLSLGTRLGRLGLVNEHVPDPVLLSQVDEAVFLEKDGGVRQRADLKSVGEKLCFSEGVLVCKRHVFNDALC